MSIQKKVVACYFSVAFLLILVHYGASAQAVLPDAKIKTHISTLNNSLETLMQLQPKRFEYNTYAFDFLNLPRGKHYGFLTEDFQQVFPHLVRHQTRSYTTGKNSVRAALIPEIELDKLVPVLVGAIQEQQELISQLQQEVADLKKQMTEVNP